MNMRLTSDLFIYEDFTITAGHRPGILRMGDWQQGEVSLLFMAHDPIPHLEQLREEVQKQIDAIKAARVQAGQTGPSIYAETLPPNAPAAELAAPWVPPHAPGSELAESIRKSESQWIQGRADALHQGCAGPQMPAASVKEEKVIVLDDDESTPF